MKSSTYKVVDRLRGITKTIKTFPTKRSCRAWLLEGLYATDGAEREHYVSMLCQLDGGSNELKYWEVV